MNELIGGALLICLLIATLIFVGRNLLKDDPWPLRDDDED